jgi:glycosyltransferase involved in cell wall biosynthesis
MVRSKVAIIIPAFNEEETITKVVKKASKFGKVIVINDGSSDKTGEKAKRSGAILQVHKVNLGYDAALNTGFKKAVKLKFNFIITLDADGQHEPKLLKKFIGLLNTDVSTILGVRNKKARLAEYIFGFYTNYRYGIIDPLCGLKAYRVKDFKSKQFFNSYKSIGTEMMLRNISLGNKFKQVHFNVKERKGRARFGNSILANLKIIQSLIFCLLKKY